MFSADKVKRIIIIISLFNSIISVNVYAQKTDVFDFFLEFSKLYNSGDFIGAERCMLNVLDPEYNSPPGYLYGAYNNLGLIKKSLGLYDEALRYYDKAEGLILNDSAFSTDLSIIYSNKSRIYTFLKAYPTAIDFLEKSVRILKTDQNPTLKILDRLSSSYINLGIVYYESGEYNLAINSLNESLRLKTKHNLPEIELTYLNLAKTHARIGNVNQAEEFFERSLKSMRDQFGDKYYRIPEVYFGYAAFLNQTGRIDEALNAHNEALAICLKVYGEKHTLVSLAYMQIAEYYSSHSEYPKALEYYQKALIAVVRNFNDPSIYSNPVIDSSYFSIRLLEVLKSKATTLEQYSGILGDPSDKLNTLNKSLETIELALQLIERIRNDYLTEESRIYLAENEKETYISAVRIAGALYELAGEDMIMNRMYRITSMAKAALLRNEISSNDLLWSAGIPDSLYRKQVNLSLNIAAYNSLLLEESQKTKPDSNRISVWKDALFDMNREKEKISALINEQFPRIRELLGRMEPLPAETIQKSLGRNEIIIDYLLSNEYEEGKRVLHAFILTRKDIGYFRYWLDSLFMQNAMIIRNHNEGSTENDFTEFTAALNYMYNTLIKPAEGFFDGKKLIIIPDEEIAWLPFDAFLKQLPGPDQSDYEGLPFLTRDYSISYRHSSSLIPVDRGPGRKGRKVYAFSPDYSRSDTTGNARESLQGTAKETASIFRSFRGTGFTGSAASEHNFRLALNDRAIFHLAMHSVTDTLSSKYSWLAFDTQSDTIHDGKLFNYEISLMRIRSPMVVLSACNSGTGTLYHGEGLMSMARSFILAGASSVVRTSWEVNDETSAEVISGFYRYLSRGRSKDEALRQAKLDFMDNSTPFLSDPYYWAAYEVTGNTAPVSGMNSLLIICIAAASVMASGAVYYLRRRRIFAERSE